MSAEEILGRAANLIEESWGQGHSTLPLNYDHGPYCAGIAIQIAAAGQLIVDVDAAWRAFMREIGAESMSEIPTWNDEPGRRKEEVATAMRNSKRWL